MSIMPTLRDALRLSQFERSFLRVYRTLFSIKEIEGNKVLQWILGATIFSYFLTFNAWTSNTLTTIDAVTQGTYRCWPYFQECASLYFLRTLPYGYSQSLLYMVLFGSLALAVYLMYRRDWLLAHMALLPSFLWHTFASFVLTGALSGNYDYYLFIFAFVILFLPHKEFFLKLAVVFFYVLSSVSKIHPAWILGTYFSALKTGLPIFPDFSIPLWTNLVIFMEMVGSWFLMSKHSTIQRPVLFFFVVFHLYSGLLVEYRYPAIVLPTILILFGPLHRYTSIPVDRKSLFGWFLIVCMFCAQMAPLLIPGDEKLTMEGNRLGLYMFESNHQCISTTQVYYRDGSTKQQVQQAISARSRCEVYRYWFQIQLACKAKRDSISTISWTFDHSINGGPFLRIVDVPDVCGLIYNGFRHNEWIKTENDNPQIIGYPVENIYD